MLESLGYAHGSIADSELAADDQALRSRELHDMFTYHSWYPRMKITDCLMNGTSANCCSSVANQTQYLPCLMPKALFADMSFVTPTGDTLHGACQIRKEEKGNRWEKCSGRSLTAERQLRLLAWLANRDCASSAQASNPVISLRMLLSTQFPARSPFPRSNHR